MVTHLNSEIRNSKLEVMKLSSLHHSITPLLHLAFVLCPLAFSTATEPFPTYVTSAPANATLTGSEVFPLIQSAGTVKLSLNDLKTWIGTGSGGSWGSITGTLSNQTDLQSALNAKQSLTGTLALAGFSSITGTLANANLANSSITINGSPISLGGSVSSLQTTNGALALAGFGSITGTLANANLANSSISINGSPISLGGSVSSLQTTNGTLALAGFGSITGTIPIANGGTGQTTAANAINALVPSQTGQSGKVLGTNGTSVSWVSGGGGSFDPTQPGPIGGTTPDVGSFTHVISNDNNTSADKIYIGDAPGLGFPGIWFGAAAASPGYGNYSFLSDGSGGCLFNADGGSGINFRLSNSNQIILDSLGIRFMPSSLLMASLNTGDFDSGEWFSIDWQSVPNVCIIGTDANGSGTARPLRIKAAGTVLTGGLLSVDGSGNVGTDGSLTQSIAASGTYTPQTEAVFTFTVTGARQGDAVAWSCDTGAIDASITYERAEVTDDTVKLYFFNADPSNSHGFSGNIYVRTFRH
jgi:hypothetical protein